MVQEFRDSEDHDVVPVDECGTGDGHRLDCRSPGYDDNLEAYLNGRWTTNHGGQASSIC